MCLKSHCNIVRYCSPKTVDNGVVTAAAFRLRTNKVEPEKYLSINWVEYFKCNIQLAVNKICSILKKKLSLNKNGKFALINIGDMVDYVKSNTSDKRLLVIKRPNKFSFSDKSHYGIFGYSDNDNNNIPALIAFKVKQIFDVNI